MVDAFKAILEAIKKHRAVYEATLLALLAVAIAIIVGGSLWIQGLHSIVSAKEIEIGRLVAGQLDATTMATAAQKARIDGLQEALVNQKNNYEIAIGAAKGDYDRMVKQEDALVKNLEQASGWTKWLIDECEKRMRLLQQTPPEQRDEQTQRLLSWLEARRDDADAWAFKGFMGRAQMPPRGAPVPPAP